MMALGSVMLFLAALGYVRMQRAGWLVYLGRISYGLYVWHVLGLNLAKRPDTWLRSHSAISPSLLELLRTTLGLALTIFMAHLSYRYLEAPFLRLKERFAVVRTRPI